MKRQQVLGIDYGDARVGVAISDELGMLAHPVETITCKVNKPVERIAQIVRDRDIGRVVVGLPRNMDGSYGQASEKVKIFADQLRERLSVPVELWDERLTTVMARRSLHEAGKNTRKQKGMIDQVAAQAVLQNWLDAKEVETQRVERESE